MNQRYERNIPAISIAEQQLLFQKKVLILGCGGLGEYIAQYLARSGIKQITAVDHDQFETSNLNRQLFSSHEHLGHSKVLITAENIQKAAPETVFVPVTEYFQESNASELIHGQDLVIDALDNLPSRLLMEDTCEKENVPFIHGAILGWNLQVTTCMPGSRVLHRLYGHNIQDQNQDKTFKTSLPMTPAICAAIQTAEALKLLVGQEPSLSGNLFIMNLQTMESSIIQLP